MNVESNQGQDQPDATQRRSAPMKRRNELLKQILENCAQVGLYSLRGVERLTGVSRKFFSRKINAGEIQVVCRILNIKDPVTGRVLATNNPPVVLITEQEALKYSSAADKISQFRITRDQTDNILDLAEQANLYTTRTATSAFSISNRFFTDRIRRRELPTYKLIRVRDRQTGQVVNTPNPPINLIHVSDIVTIVASSRDPRIRRKLQSLLEKTRPLFPDQNPKP